MKRILSVILSAIIICSALMSFAAFPVAASGFSVANISSSGLRVEKGELKGNSGSSSNYTRTQSGSGVSRVVLCTMKQAFKSSTRIIDNACDTEIDAHFVHARTLFSIKQVGSEKIVFRINAMSTDWNSNNNPIFNIVIPANSADDALGYISAYGGTNKGATDNDQCY